MDSGLVYGCLVPHPPILVPAIGGHRIEQVRQTRDAMQRVAGEIEHLAPDTLVVVSPHADINSYSMGVAAVDNYVGGFERFGTSSVKLSARGDPKLPMAIEDACRAFGVPCGRLGRGGGTHRLDHGAAVPLFFFHRAGVRCDLVLVSFSLLGVEPHRLFGKAIAAAAKDVGKRVVLVASGDFSHRLIPGAPVGYSPRGREFDESVVTGLRRRDFLGILNLDRQLVSDAGECGYRSLVVALGAMPEAEVEVLSYEGPFGVGYLVARFLVRPAEPETCECTEVVPSTEGLGADELEALGLARRAVEYYVRERGVVPVPPKLEGLLARRAGVFVSLKMEGQLRGCIGTFQPTEPNVATEIVRNAIASATRDPRFLPVARDELAALRYSIDVLSEPESVDSISQLDPKGFGVIVQAGSRRGLLLPDLEGVSSVEDQVDIARRKAGIPSGAPIQLHRFTVQRIREPE